jgi:aspartokinase/homoserine dehydrogenase 1
MKQRLTYIFLVGTGLIGSSVLNLISRCAKGRVRVVGIGNSRKMVFNKSGIPLQSWKKQLAQSKPTMNLRAFVERASLFKHRERIFVDCTASDEVVSYYDTLLRAGISIVTPNKKGLTGSWEDYRRLKRLSVQTSTRFLYDTTVGAGLPVISTLKKLLVSGDRIIKIEGVFSGTLSYIFNHFVGERRFGDVVLEAKEKGFTEPDPRDDLSGNDVSRKLLSLHPFYHLSGSDNIVSFTTANYNQYPLVIKGAGAGASVFGKPIIVFVL